MRRTGKWLAVLLSVTMLAGTAPVYGADISVESDFSSEISGEDSLSDDLGESEITEEPECRKWRIVNGNERCNF